nr:hypothetical protein [Tanacetum cinerariifolium]
MLSQDVYPVFVNPESSTQADGAQSSRVPVPLPEDPYEAIRQAYLLRTNTKSEPFEGEARTPESPHIVAPPTCHVEEPEGSSMSGARSTSSDSTTPQSPDHPFTHTTPILVTILRRTARMAVRVLPVMLYGLSAGMAVVAAMSDSAFRKSEEDEEVEESSDSDSESEDVEDEGPTTEDEDPAAGDEGLAARVKGPVMDDESYGLNGESYGLDDEIRSINGEGRGIKSDGLGLREVEAVPEGQQRAVLVVGTAVSEPLGLGYGVLRRQELALEEDHVYSTFEVGQGSGSAPKSERSDRVLAFRQPTLTIWTDLEDGYDDHRLVHDMLLLQTALQRELQEMRDRVIVLEQERDRRER